VKVTKKQLAKLVLESTDLARHLKNSKESFDSFEAKLATSSDTDLHIHEIYNVLRNVVEYLLAKSKAEKVT